MEKKVCIVPTYEKDNKIEEMTNFYYVLEKEEVKNSRTILTFTRDISTHPDKQKILCLEEEYKSYFIPPFYITIILFIVSFLLITALLISFFLARNLIIYFVIASVPALFASGIYSRFRTSRITKNINHGKEKEKILNKLKEIKENEKRWKLL